MFSWANIILLALQIVQGIIARKSFSDGEKAQMGASLIQTAGMVGDAKKVAEWVSKQRPDVIDQLLSNDFRD